MTRLDVDVAVIGSGFAGSLTSLCLRHAGLRVAMLERGRHPRFAIGESSTPLANLLLEEIADRCNLPELRAFSKWGTWQQTHPSIPCGLKRGFTFLFHQLDEPFRDDSRHARQLMVAASPHDAVADTHWYRPAFDAALVTMATDAGVDYTDQTRIDRLTAEGDTWLIDGEREGSPVGVRAGFVVDASGPRGCLHQLLGLHEAPLQWLPPTEGLFTHFEQLGRWDGAHPADEAPPYPPDDAALHHVFPGGWIWILRFSNGLTSAGAALTPPLAAATRRPDPAAHWRALLERLPSVRQQFGDARAVLPFAHTPALAFRAHQVTGPGWALLPSAAGIIDPLLSTGFPLTLLGILRLSDALAVRRGPVRDAALAAYARETSAELDATERLVGALYAVMDDPVIFKRLALLYFAAASYSEAVRRLGRPERAPGFLLHGHPSFGPGLRACTDAVRTALPDSARTRLLDQIDATIEPFDTAGLLDRSRHDWYPVLASDLLQHAHRLGAGVVEVRHLLHRCGFAGPDEIGE